MMNNYVNYFRLIDTGIIINENISKNNNKYFTNELLCNIYSENTYNVYEIIKKASNEKKSCRWIGYNILPSNTELIMSFDIKFISNIPKKDNKFFIKTHNPEQIYSNWLEDCIKNEFTHIEIPLYLNKEKQLIIFIMDEYLPEIHFMIKNICLYEKAKQKVFTCDSCKLLTTINNTSLDLLNNKITVILHINTLNTEDLNKFIKFSNIYPTTNFIIFNFINNDYEKVNFNDYKNIKLINIYHISDIDVLNYMFNNNLPCINSVHKLYYFDIIKNLYKYIIINNYFSLTNDFYNNNVISHNIIFTRFNYFLNNYNFCYEYMNNNFYKQYLFRYNQLEIEDVLYIFTKNNFITFLKTIGTEEILHFISKISIKDIYPEKILYLFLENKNILKHYTYIDNLNQYNISSKFIVNINKYSKSYFNDKFNKYIKHGLENDKCLTFQLPSDEKILINLKNNNDMNKISKVIFDFLPWTKPEEFNNIDLQNILYNWKNTIDK